MDNCKVLVSITCMAYNHEKYIRQALDGFLSQKTNFSYEIIIHEDASTDGTAAIVREYEARFPEIIKPIYQFENQYSQKVNIFQDIMLPRAKGKYIACCEGDDYWVDPNKLQKQVDFLESHPEFSASMHNCFFVDADGNETQNIYPIYRPYRSHVYDLKRMSRDVVYPGQTASLVFRKTAYDFDSQEQREAFFDIRIKTGDKRTHMKLLLEGDMYCFEEKMSAYRIVTQGGDSWSARNKGKNTSYLLHIASIDFRKYIKKYHNRSFLNYYTTFHTGVAGVLKSIIKPTDENKDVCKKILAEHGGFIGTMFYLFGLGIISIPLFFIREKEKKKYDPKE